MIKKLLISAFFMSIFVVAFCQQRFDYGENFYPIRIESVKPTGSYCYDSLLARFENDMDIQTHFDVIAMLIGHTAKDSYQPFKDMEDQQNVVLLMGKKNYKDALIVCNRLLSKEPMSYAGLMYKSSLLERLKMDSVDIFQKRFMVIEDAILNISDGSLENPYFILNPMDAQTYLMFRKGWKIVKAGTGRDKNGLFLDVVEVNTGTEVKKMYFNVSHARLRKDGLLDKMQQDYLERKDIADRMVEVEKELAKNADIIDAFLVIKANSLIGNKIELPSVLRVNKKEVTNNIQYDTKGQMIDAGVVIGKNVFELKDKNGKLIKSAFVTLKGSDMVNISINVKSYIEASSYFEVEIIVTEDN